MPRMLDLFCGRFGWSRAFAARGWECVGVDLVEPAEIPEGCTVVKADILKMRYSSAVGFYIVDGPVLGFFDAVCASSSCEQFSVHGMKHFYPNPPNPELGILLFNHTRSLCEASGVPYVMENVRAAQQFVGPSVNHAGPFHLWGNAVPAIVPQGITKGTRMLPGGVRNRILASGGDLKGYRRKVEGALNIKMGAKCRREAIAALATIPPELASCVAAYAERLLEVSA